MKTLLKLLALLTLMVGSCQTTTFVFADSFKHDVHGGAIISKVLNNGPDGVSVNATNGQVNLLDGFGSQLSLGNDGSVYLTPNSGNNDFFQVGSVGSQWGHGGGSNYTSINLNDGFLDFYTNDLNFELNEGALTYNFSNPGGGKLSLNGNGLDMGSGPITGVNNIYFPFEFTLQDPTTPGHYFDMGGTSGGQYFDLEATDNGENHYYSEIYSDVNGFSINQGSDYGPGANLFIQAYQNGGNASYLVLDAYNGGGPKGIFSVNGADLDMNNNAIKGVAALTNNGNISLNAAAAGNIQLNFTSGLRFTVDDSSNAFVFQSVDSYTLISAGGMPIINLANPTNNGDADTKGARNAAVSQAVFSAFVTMSAGVASLTDSRITTTTVAVASPDSTGLNVATVEVHTYAGSVTLTSLNVLESGRVHLMLCNQR